MPLKVDTIQNPSSATVNLTLDTSGNVTAGGNLTVSGTGNQSFSGNVGIGTSSPEAKASIVSSAGAIGLTIKDANAGASNYLSAQYNGTTGVADIKAQSSGGSTQIAFSTSSSGTTAERMRIDSAGIVTGTAGNLMLVNLAKVNLSSTATALSTAIPSWAKKITLAINGLSSNGTADYQVQIGSGSYTTTGYTSFSNVVASTGGATTSTTGFVIRNNEGAAQVSYGHMTLTLQDSATNTWVSSHSMGCTNGAGKYELIGGGGVVALAGALDRIQITAGGTDLLDAGSINIQYE